MQGGKRGRDSDEDDVDHRVVSTQRRRRKEVAMLMAEQGKLASAEEMLELQSYVKDVFDSKPSSSSMKSRRERALGVTTLPDMFGLVRGRSQVSSDVAGSNRPRGSGEASRSNERDVVTEASFHQHRWLLLQRLVQRDFVWVPSSPEDEMDSATDLRSKQTLSSSAKGKNSDDDEDADSNDDDMREDDVQSRLRRRRQEQDAAAKLRFVRDGAQEPVLHNPMLDAVMLRDREEFDSLMTFFDRLQTLMVEDTDAKGTFTYNSFTVWFSPLRAVGYEGSAHLLSVFGGTRNMIVTHDRWMVLSESEDEHVCRFWQPLTLDEVCSTVNLLQFGLVTMRFLQVSETLKGFPTTSVAGSAASLLLRLLKVHPYSLTRLVASSAGGVESASLADETPSSALTSCAQGLRMVWMQHIADRERRVRLSSVMTAESANNVPLQRQEQKLKELTAAFLSLKSKIEASELELGLQSLDEELVVQCECSRRLAEGVHGGLFFRDALATEVCSYIMEATLWTLPRAATVQHREIEEALEKYLWGHPYALMNDELQVVHYVDKIRQQLLINLVLRRASARKNHLMASLRRLEVELTAAVEAQFEDGVLLPRV